MAQIPSMAKKRGRPREEAMKNKEVEEDTISSFYNREYKDEATQRKLMAEERGAVAQSVHAISITERYDLKVVILSEYEPD